MSREEAAAKALYERMCEALLMDATLKPWDELSEGERTSSIIEVRAELAVADAHDLAHGVHRIALDDATVERAARALMYIEGYEWLTKPSEHHRKITRAVLAAAVQEER